MAPALPSLTSSWIHPYTETTVQNPEKGRDWIWQEARTRASEFPAFNSVKNHDPPRGETQATCRLHWGYLTIHSNSLGQKVKMPTASKTCQSNLTRAGTQPTTIPQLWDTVAGILRFQWSALEHQRRVCLGFRNSNAFNSYSPFLLYH